MYAKSVMERQFCEPHEWWEQYDEAREREWQSLIAGKSCLDCNRCRKCEKHPDTGFCMEDGEFVYDTDLVAENGCEFFRAA